MPDPLRNTWVFYQGIPCESGTLIRSRGWEADAAEVVISVEAFPSLALGDPAVDASPGADVQIARFAGAPPPLPELTARGALVMSEGPDGAGKTVTADHLYILRCDAIRHASAGAPDHVRIVAIRLALVDGRYFLLSRGIARRWRWNDYLPDGAPDASTMKGGATPYTRAEVAAELVADAALGAKGGIRGLARTPERWASDRGRMAFRPLGLAGEALRDLAERRDGAAVPTLRLGGALALYSIGDGRVGYATDPNGENTEDIPPQMWADADGTGQLRAVEAQYPDAFLVVTGKPRIATVAIDDWEPVLFVRDRAYYLSEQLIRALTGNRFGLRWLRKAVMSEDAFKGAGLDPEVAELFASQAYRLFRLPGVELVEDGWYTGTLGPNAHLLPLLDRAETIGGRRAAPVVETFTWALRHRSAAGTSSAAADRVRALQRLQEVERKLQEVSIKLQVPYPLRPPRPEDLVEDFLGPDPLVRDLGDALQWTQVEQFIGSRELGALGVEGLNKAELSGYLDEWRKIKAGEKREGGGALAGEYAKARKERLEADDKETGGASVATWDLAEKLIALEFEQLQRRNAGESLQEALEQIRPAIDAAVKQANDAVVSRQLEQKRRKELGIAQTPALARFTLNITRGPDTGARVWNAEAGIVRCSQLAGHAAEVVPDPGSTSLVPCPVRVLFGTRLRPTVARPVTQDNRTPEDIADQAKADKEATRAKIQEVSEAAARALQAGNAEEYQRLDAERRRLIADDLAADIYGTKRPVTGDTGGAKEHPPCAGGDNVIPEVLTDREALYTAAFKRTGQGQAEPVKLEAVPLEQATPHHVEWEELIPLSGPGNRTRLDGDALQLARQAFGAPDTVAGWQRTAHGAWPVQCDGLVSQVRISTKFKAGIACGLETVITVGGVAAPLSLAEGQTRERGRR